MKPVRVLDPNLPTRMARGLCALAVMTKAPQAGRVKTRLVPPLTPEEAAELNKCFRRDTAAAISSVCGGGLRRPNTDNTQLLPGAQKAPPQCGPLAVYTPIGAESAYTAVLPADLRVLAPR